MVVNRKVKTMLEKTLEEYRDWLKLGEVMSKKPIAYFASEEARGQYAGYLRTKAWYEIQIANYMEMESEDNVFPVEVKVGKQY